MNTWHIHRQMRVRRSQAMFALLLRGLHRLRAGWRTSQRIVWQLRQVG